MEYVESRTRSTDLQAGLIRTVAPDPATMLMHSIGGPHLDHVSEHLYYLLDAKPGLLACISKFLFGSR